jgi:hypothetical protein
LYRSLILSCLSKHRQSHKSFNCFLISQACIPMPLALYAMIFWGLRFVVGIALQESKHNFIMTATFSSSVAAPERSVIICNYITICFFSLHWLTWGLTGVLMCMASWRLLLFCSDGCCPCCWSELRRAAANYRSGVVYFEKNVLPANPGVVARRFLLRCNSSFAWLQPL